MSEADARKGAYTNGLKKAAAMFGCGRQAYEGTLDDDNVPSQDLETALRQSAKANAQPAATQHLPTAATTPTSQAAPATPASQQQTRNRLTAKQLSAIWAIARKLGMDQHGVRGMVKSRYNVQPEFLARAQASELIGELSKQAGNGHAAEFEQAAGGAAQGA